MLYVLHQCILWPMMTCWGSMIYIYAAWWLYTQWMHVHTCKSVSIISWLVLHNPDPVHAFFMHKSFKSLSHSLASASVHEQKDWNLSYNNLFWWMPLIPANSQFFFIFILSNCDPRTLPLYNWSSRQLYYWGLPCTAARQKQNYHSTLYVHVCVCIVVES